MKHPQFRYIVEVDSDEDKNRIRRLEGQLQTRDRHGSRLCWIRWDPNSKYGYQIDDAREDVRWMVYEIKKLQAENAELKEFVNRYREQVEKELSED